MKGKRNDHSNAKKTMRPRVVKEESKKPKAVNTHARSRTVSNRSFKSDYSGTSTRSQRKALPLAALWVRGADGKVHMYSSDSKKKKITARAAEPVPVLKKREVERELKEGIKLNPVFLKDRKFTSILKETEARIRVSSEMTQPELAIFEATRKAAAVPVIEENLFETITPNKLLHTDIADKRVPVVSINKTVFTLKVNGLPILCKAKSTNQTLYGPYEKNVLALKFNGTRYCYPESYSLKLNP
jgi:hypothetical protein